MTKGRTSKPYSSPKLVVPREEAIQRIKERIELGRGIRDQRMSSMMDLESALQRRTKWLENNIEVMTRLFNSPFFEGEYNMSDSLDMDSAITFTLKEKYFKDNINEEIGKLESFLERLKLIPEATPDERMEQSLIEEPMRQEQSKEIESMKGQLREALTSEWKPREELPSTRILNQGQFLGGNILLIHGRDEAAKKSILNLIEKFGLRAITLHEQPDGVRGIIEGFEESSNINFVIILMTQDDITAPRNKPTERQGRMSQNVIFELGYFMGKLGRGRVCILYKEGLEIPSDYPGVVSIPMDARGGWRLLVAKEMKQAGIEIDLNKAI